jgi:hypothetical protein
VINHPIAGELSDEEKSEIWAEKNSQSTEAPAVQDLQPFHLGERRKATPDRLNVGKTAELKPCHYNCTPKAPMFAKNGIAEPGFSKPAYFYFRSFEGGEY